MVNLLLIEIHRVYCSLTHWNSTLFCCVLIFVEMECEEILCFLCQ
jgi:hypothetical protein